MAFMAKRRAQAHYNAGSRILVNLLQPSYRDKGYEEVEKRTGKALSSVPTEPDEAIKHLRKSLGKASSSIPRDLEKAIKHLQKAVNLDPSFADAFHNLAHVWYNVAEYNAAVSFVHPPQDAEASIRGALQSALDAVDQALALRYDFPQAHNTRAMVLAKLGRLDEAIEATEVALLQAPDYSNAIDNREKMKELRKQSAIREV
jgi:tetratricopeptide (TPR) repeat protein